MIFLKFLIGFRHATSAAFQSEKECEIPLAILAISFLDS